jgi:hypothetical protein
MRLTKDEQTVLDRHLALATKIANTDDSIEAVKFAYAENDSLAEGLNRGRLTLTRIAQVSRYLVKPGHPDGRKKKDRELIEEMAELPEFKQMAKTFDKLKEHLLDNDAPGFQAAKQQAMKAADEARRAKNPAP